MAHSIHAACRCGDLEAVRAFVAEDPTVVNVDDEHRWRPLFHASLGRHVEVVRLLLDAGADIAAHNGDVLHYASEVPDNQKVVQLLVAYGALETHTQPTDDASRQLLAALFLADGTRVHALLAQQPHLASMPDGRGDQPIHHAARNGALVIVQHLVAAGADVHALSARGHTALYCAGGHGHVDVVNFLLENGADPKVKFTSDGKTLREWLSQYANDDQRLAKVAELLDSHKA